MIFQNKNYSYKILTLYFMSLFFLPVRAAGIIAVCSEGVFSYECSKNDLYLPVYPKSNSKVLFKYRVDKNGIGDINEEDSILAIEDVLNIWEAESNISFIKDGTGQLSEDVSLLGLSGKTLTQEFQKIQEDFLDPSFPLGYSPIILDNDGSILDALYGKGSKEDILGFAGGSFYSGYETERNGETVFIITGIKESQSLFNGYLFSQINRNDLGYDKLLKEFKSTILHEFAHMLGIDHSQGGYTNEFFNDEDFNLKQVPIMYPILANPELELHRDDISAISYAYPKNSNQGNFGTIQGNLKQGGKALRGANLIAYKTDNPEFEVVSSASDIQGKNTGAFLIPNLVPGDYILKIEPIYEDFEGASSVGIFPPPTNPLSIPTGFYLNDGTKIESKLFNSLDEALEQATKLSIVAGETINLDLNLNSTLRQSFSLSGKAINKLSVLNYDEEIESIIRLKRKVKGKLRLRLSTEYPELVSFPKGNEIIIKKSKNYKKVPVRFANIKSFLEVFPSAGSEPISISLKVEDLDSGYIDETKNLEVF
jgi:hypothetical protein